MPSLRLIAPSRSRKSSMPPPVMICNSSADNSIRGASRRTGTARGELTRFKSRAVYTEKIMVRTLYDIGKGGS
jgi:hypothetical protein